MESLKGAGCRQEQTLACQRLRAALPGGIPDASQGRMLTSLGEALMTERNTSLPQEIPPGQESGAKPAWLPVKSHPQPTIQNASAFVHCGKLQNIKPVPHRCGSGRKTSPVI